MYAHIDNFASLHRYIVNVAITIMFCVQHNDESDKTQHTHETSHKKYNFNKYKSLSAFTNGITLYSTTYLPFLEFNSSSIEYATCEGQTYICDMCVK